MLLYSGSAHRDLLIVWTLTDDAMRELGNRSTKEVEGCDGIITNLFISSASALCECGTQYIRNSRHQQGLINPSFPCNPREVVVYYRKMAVNESFFVDCTNNISFVIPTLERMIGFNNKLTPAVWSEARKTTEAWYLICLLCSTWNNKLTLHNRSMLTCIY